MIIPKDDFSDESFESTEESDTCIDFNEPIGITHNNFQNTEVVWAKRPSLPWFPGIVIFFHIKIPTVHRLLIKYIRILKIIDPHAITKEIKDLMKNIGIPSPHKDQLSDYSVRTFHQNDELFFVCLFNRKKTWLWLTESKMRPFCKENDRMFLETTPLLSSKYRKELEKAYKKAKRYCKAGSNQHLNKI